MSDDRIDAYLRDLLGAPDPAPDEAFVARVERAVIAEQKMAAARRTSWQRFAVETCGSLAVIGAFFVLGRMAPGDMEIGRLSVAPMMAAGSLLVLWLGLGIRPAITR
jgi:hypothetical protein